MEYFNELTDKQWQVMKNLSNDKERKHKHSLGHAICPPYPFMPELFCNLRELFLFSARHYFQSTEEHYV